MIRFDDVSYSYTDGADCLKNINLEVQKGEVLLVCGPSGCGKSTLVRCVNGLIPHFYQGHLTGRVTVNEIDVATTPLRDISRHVGTVFQNPRSQFFNVDTTSELSFGCENFGMDPDVIEERVNQVVNEYGLEPLMDRSIFNLSGGEKQKIACGSVAAEPLDIIVLDEPSANLDYKGMCELQKMISCWKKENKTILIAEHRIAYLLHLIDRAVLMKDGEIINSLSKDDFNALGAEDLHRMGLRGKNFRNPVDMPFPNDMLDYGDNVIELQNMKFTYRKQKKPTLDIEDMKIPMGEIVAIVGTNGCGKSTFLRCLCGMEKRCKSNVYINGKKHKIKDLRSSMYLVMQDVNHQLFTDSLLEEVMISQDSEDQEKAMDILKQLDLQELSDKHPLAVSGGQKQRVAVASALASDRDIILFDEPTSGLDFYHMIQVSHLLKQLRDAGKTLIIVTHDEELIRHACTKVIKFSA